MGKSIFSRLASSSSTQAQTPFITKTGVYVIELQRIRTGETQDKTPFYASDIMVDEVLSEMPLPAKVVAFNATAKKERQIPEGTHAEGETLSFYVKIANPWIENKLGNVKNHAEATLEVLGIDDYAEWGEDQWHEAIMDQEKGLASGDGTLCKGVKLVMTSEARVAKGGDSAYIVNTFAPYLSSEE